MDMLWVYDNSSLNADHPLVLEARSGEISGFTGVDAPYEAPEAPDLVLDTGTQTLDRSVEDLLAFASKRIVLR